MSVFGQYAECYDLVYRDKDYEKEVDFVSTLIEDHAPGARSILELGCGTGAHAVLLAGRGYRVHGVDLSEDMLTQARSRLSGLPESVCGCLTFTAGDISSVQLDTQFDVALSLFHVVSYIADDVSLRDVFINVRRHLRCGGIFIFDYWHGPAVLEQQPERRTRIFEDDRRHVVRSVEPRLLVERNCVRIHVRLDVTDKPTDTVRRIEEVHLMRYFEPAELVSLLAEARFALRRNTAWQSDLAPSPADWSAMLVVEAE